MKITAKEHNEIRNCHLHFIFVFFRGDLLKDKIQISKQMNPSQHTLFTGIIKHDELVNMHLRPVFDP